MANPHNHSNPVLILNASFEPLSTVSWQRAISLVFLGKAEMIERRGDEVLRSSGGESWPFPSVIRMLEMVQKRPRGKVPLTKRALRARDYGVCQMNDCQRKGTTVDHVVPRSRGGSHVWENVVLCCSQCNHRKGDSYMEEIDWKLKRAPFAPSHEIVLRSHIKRLPEWEDWIPAPGSLRLSYQ